MYLVEAAGRERSHSVLPPLGFGEPEGRAVCAFGRGPSNHQGRRGKGGDPGVKSILRPLVKRIQTACNKDFVFVPNSPLMVMLLVMRDLGRSRYTRKLERFSGPQKRQHNEQYQVS